ncbi:MAG: hypothetical protein KC776_24410 [Myxococcales bacterium]|nr:hypothetical protein [Myxococcales bacterium]MCB9582894.1 hypothetical protein [Polyangiaceae bacterium]
MMRIVIAGLLALACAWPASALAEVERTGDWKGDVPKVSLSFDGVPRSDALKKLADEAGWSIVVEGASKEPVEVHVKDQPADKVLELLLSDRRYVVHRDGTLLSIKPAPDEPAAPVASAAKPAEEAGGVLKKQGEDRTVTGGNIRVEKNEVVRDLTVMGGNADVLGTVTGDLSVMGGSAVVRNGARVKGDATVLGGALEVEDGARVDGDVGVLGGRLRRGKSAKIGGDVSSREDGGFSLTRTLRDVGSAITRTALLFVFGAVLLALATRRMESMQKEIAARPMRTFALGVVGVIVFGVLVVVLCVTIIGIPLAVIAALLGAFGTYAGIAAVLATAGGALAHHKTPNAYVHLAIGCFGYLVLSSLPWIGGLVTAVVVLIGIGALVATRAAGFVPSRRRRDDGPYRTAEA